MVNSRRPPLLSADHQYSALDERVYGLATQISGVEKDVSELRTAIVGKIDALYDKIAERAQPKWQVIIGGVGLIVVILTTIGTLAYWPISTSIVDIKDILKADISSQNNRFVPRSEVELRKQWSDERYETLKSDIDKLEDQVSRSFTVKDAITTLRERVDRMQGVLTDEVRRGGSQ